MQTDTLYQVALGLVPKIGAITAKKLLHQLGSAEAVFRSKATELEKIPGIGPQLARQLLNTEVLQRAERECTLAQQHGIKLLTQGDKRYPDRLRHNRDSPLVLFVKHDP